MLKQNPKITGQEKWQKRHSYKRSALKEREIEFEFLNCATQLGKNMLDNKERSNEQRS